MLSYLHDCVVTLLVGNSVRQPLAAFNLATVVCNFLSK